MAAGAFFTRSTGVALWRTRGAVPVVSAVVSVASVMAAAVLSRSDFSRARNSGRGASASARASQSICGESGIGALHSRSQRLQRPELKLLDGAFALVESRGDLPDAPLLDVAFDDHGPLIGGKLLDQTEHERPLVDQQAVRLGIGDPLGQPIRVDDFAGGALRPIDDGVGRNPNQPRAE